MNDLEDVKFSVTDGHGRIVLNRPDAHNALTLEMIDAMVAQLQAWETLPDLKAVVIAGAGDQAFCSGGDLRALYAAKQRGDFGHLENFFRREYTLVHRLATYAKPVVAVMDGLTMGGGASIALSCSHPVVTERTVFAMPECRAGMFPGVGTGYFLNKCELPIALALGLTGLLMRGPGLFRLGLSNHYIEGASPDSVCLDNLGAISQPVPPAAIMRLRAGIREVFGLKTVDEIVTVLGARDETWAKEMHQAVKGFSPTSLKVAFAHINRARGMPLADILQTEFRLSQHFINGNDFFEGVRAHLIDKDKEPSWRPAELALVPAEAVEAFFAPITGIRDWAPVRH
jgi:enoyl-CoA hydratase/carnithine racemase